MENQWVVLVTKEERKGVMQECDFIAPIKWLSEDEKFVFWPKSNPGGKVNSYPDGKTWKEIEVVKVKLRGEKSICKEWIDKVSSASEADLSKRPEKPIPYASQSFSLPEKPNSKSRSTGKSKKTTSSFSATALYNLTSDESDSSPPRGRTVDKDISLQTTSRSRSRSRESFRASESQSESDDQEERRSTPKQPSCKRRRTASSNLIAKDAAAINKNFPMDNYRFQKQAISLLLRIVDFVEGGAVGGNNNQQQPTIQSIEMIESMERFNEVELSLEDKDIYSSFITQLSKIGGKNLFTNTRAVMEKLLSYKVMSEFNMLGKTRKDGKTKIAFRNKKICQAIIASVISNQKETTEADVLEKVAGVLKYAPDKVGAGGRKNEHGGDIAE